jgi:hypothetical protein
LIFTYLYTSIVSNHTPFPVPLGGCTGC